MVAEIDTLHKDLLTKVKIYKRNHKREPTVDSLARVLGNTLYGRRFFPIYAFNLLCGLQENGEGIVFGYDAIGSYDTLTYGVQGSGQFMASPLLDNQFIGHNHIEKKTAQQPVEEVEAAAKDIINSVAERDIYTGDQVEIVVISKGGVTRKRENIRRD